MMRVEVSLRFPPQEYLDHIMASCLVCTNYKLIRICHVHSLETILITANTCVICSGAKKMLLPNGIWWSIGLGAAFLVGGWRVIAG